jgi:hypothetical protein
MDEAVRRWRQSGLIYFWFERNKRQGEGWHLAADEAGCRDIEELTTLAETSKFPARFELTPAPTQAGSRNPKSLTVSHSKTWAAAHWRLVTGVDKVTLELGSDGLAQLRRVADETRAGEADYTIGGNDDSDRIWIWWCPSR